MLEERKYNQPKQKLIYSKDSSLNFGMQQSINEAKLLGLFKSNSSLSRSIRTSASSTANPLKSTATLILNQSGMSLPKDTISQKQTLGMNQSNMKMIPEEEEKTKFPGEKWSAASIISETPKNQMDIKIRNLIHDYTNIDTNDYSYNIFSNLKSKKRVENLDTIDEYEIWKTKKINDSENEVKNKITELKQHLDDTKNEIYSKFSMKDEELIPMTQKDIDEVSNFYNGVFKVRDDNINDCIKNTIDIFNNCQNEVNLKIVKLGNDLDRIGYLLEEEIKDLCDDKRKYINRFTEVKSSYYSRLINEIREVENEIKGKSSKDLEEYILRWKNIKLNHYISELQKLLKSKEYSDSQERADIIKDLKKAQEEIYLKRYNLIFEKLFKLDYEQINTKNIQKIIKNFEEIVAEGEKILTSFVEKLMKNSEDVQNKSLVAFEKFKEDVATISYDYNKDNHNEKKYNDYDDIKNLDGVILDNSFDTYEMLKVSDMLISDYSSILVEATVREMPIYMYVYDYNEYRLRTGLNIDFDFEPIGKYRYKDPKDLAKALEEEYDMEAGRAFRDKYIEVNYRDSIRRMAYFIQSLTKDDEKAK